MASAGFFSQIYGENLAKKKIMKSLNFGQQGPYLKLVIEDVATIKIRTIKKKEFSTGKRIKMLSQHLRNEQISTMCTKVSVQFY